MFIKLKRYNQEIWDYLEGKSLKEKVLTFLMLLACCIIIANRAAIKLFYGEDTDGFI